MKTRTLGRTGLEVTELGMGCWAIGGNGYGPTDDKESLATLEMAWECGVRFFDTADTYGHGHSEELVSKFLKTKRREEYVLATKVGWDFYHGPARKNFDPSYIAEACEQSLKRLNVEAIDLYQLHNPTPDIIERGDAIGALEKLQKQGKIRFVGISIHTERDARTAMADSRVDALQLILNCLDQRLTGSVFEEIKKKNVGVLAREPLACGLLSGRYAPNHEFHKIDHRRRWIPEKREQDYRNIERVHEVIAEYPGAPIQAALEFVLGFDEVSTVIPGAKTPAQMKANVESSLNPRLDKSTFERLKKLYQENPSFQEALK